MERKLLLLPTSFSFLVQIISLGQALHVCFLKFGTFWGLMPLTSFLSFSSKCTLTHTCVSAKLSQKWWLAFHWDLSLYCFDLLESTTHPVWNAFLIKCTFLQQSNACWRIREVAVTGEVQQFSLWLEQLDQLSFIEYKPTVSPQHPKRYMDILV